MKKIIMETANDFYHNFFTGITSYFNVPSQVEVFVAANGKLKDEKQVETLCNLMEETKHEWKTFGGMNEILPMYGQLFFMNVGSVIGSIKNNLSKENIIGAMIETSAGIDIIATTAMQMLATIGNELTENYEKYGLTQDATNVFEHANSNLQGILHRPAQEAFSKLIDNLMLYGQTYRQLQTNFNSHLEDDDQFASQRTQLFIGYINGYVLTSLMLILLLTYPYENGQIPVNAFQAMVPSLNLFE